MHIRIKKFIHPDPLECLLPYKEVDSQELVGLFASSLAYGNVKQIIKSVNGVLSSMSPTPLAFILQGNPKIFLDCFEGFKHRWSTGNELVSLCLGIQSVLYKYGSIRACFLSACKAKDENTMPALNHLVSELKQGCQKKSSLLPSPLEGSACKRLHLYLRWMVRKDEVDLGCWSEVSAAKLIVPLDVHMHRICRAIKLTNRKQANIKTALEISHNFRQLNPEDPVRYDFSLTRLGIHKKMDALGA